MYTRLLPYCLNEYLTGFMTENGITVEQLSRIIHETTHLRSGSAFITWTEEYTQSPWNLEEAGLAALTKVTGFQWEVLRDIQRRRENYLLGRVHSSERLFTHVP